MRIVPIAGLIAATVALAACPSTPPSPDVSDTGSIDATDANTGPDGDDVPAPDVQDVLPAWLVPTTLGPRAHFPASFMWGSATAPYQIEGMLDNTDWRQWEQMGHIANNDRADDGPQSLTPANYTADIQTLVDMHQNSYRFGIEWAHVFPTAAAWSACKTAWTNSAMSLLMRRGACRAAANASGLAYYHSVLAALASHGITPLATLQHFVLPTYVNDLTMDWMTQGWMRAGLVDDLAAWAGFAAAEYGSEVDWWVTLNEPTGFAATAYLLGIHPPGRVFETGALPTVLVNMIHAHVAMYDAIHTNDTSMAHPTGPITPAAAAFVSIAHNAPKFFGQSPTDRRDVATAARLDQIYNRTFYDAIVLGNLDLNANGTIDPGEPMNDAALRGRADYIGVNYYTISVVQTNSAIPLLHAAPSRPQNDRGLPKTDFGWDIYARGMFDTLTWAGAYRLPGATQPLPVLITENGIADRTDMNRPRFIVEHLAQVAAAIQSGVNVIGYFHWSNIDNFEWASGYCPKFGLYSINFADPARPRTARPSAALLRQIIMAGEVSDAVLMGQPAYQPPSAFCSDGLSRDAGM